jgi:CubicO group peptidase (beta-lactamase class C family)
MEYSGGGIMVSQLMLMDVSKQSYDQYMYHNIFKTIGMTNSFYTQPPPLNKLNHLATGYDTLGNEVKGKYPILMEQAAGGLWTTPTDICKFVIEIQRSLKGESNKVLSKQFTEMMLTPYLNDQTALGFFIKDNMGAKYFGHDAGNVGFSGAFYGSLEDGKGIAVFINSENSDILMEIINSVAEVYDWKGFIKKEKIKTVVVPDSLMKKYIGIYEATDNQGKKIKIEIYEKGQNYFYKTNNQERNMYFSSSTEFVNNESPTKKSFKLDTNGNVISIVVRNAEKQSIFKKIN